MTVAVIVVAVAALTVALTPAWVKRSWAVDAKPVPVTVTDTEVPSPADAGTVAAVLRAGGAREWQVELTRDLLTEAIAAR